MVCLLLRSPPPTKSGRPPFPGNLSPLQINGCNLGLSTLLAARNLPLLPEAAMSRERKGGGGGGGIELHSSSLPPPPTFFISSSIHFPGFKGSPPAPTHPGCCINSGGGVEGTLRAGRPKYRGERRGQNKLSTPFSSAEGKEGRVGKKVLVSDLSCPPTNQPTSPGSK